MGVLTDKYFICSRKCSALAGTTLGMLFCQHNDVKFWTRKCQYHTWQERTLPHERLESSWILEESKCHSHLQHGQSRRSRRYVLGLLTSVPGKGIEQPILETLSKLLKDRRWLGAVKMGLKTGNHTLTNVTVFQNMATSSVGEGGAVDVVSLAFIQLLTRVALQRKTLGNSWTLSWPWSRNALL